MPGSISGGVMISPGVPPYRGPTIATHRPHCWPSFEPDRTLRTENRPKYPHGGGSGKADPGGRGLCAAATATQGSSGPPAAAPPQRLVRAHLFAKLQSIGLRLVAATNCVRHSAAPIV